MNEIADILSLWQSENQSDTPTKALPNLDVIDNIAAASSAGMYYYFVFSFVTVQIEYVNETVEDILGVPAKKFDLKTFLKRLHPDDLSTMYAKERTIFDFYHQLPKEDIPLYKTVYLFRLKDSGGNYKIILHQIKVIDVTENGKIRQIVGVHTDLTHLNIPISSKVSFISKERTSHFNIETKGKLNLTPCHAKLSFSEREVEILKSISEGKTSKEIAADLYISPHTVNTHKKNIIKKSGCKTFIELITKCIAEGVISLN